MLLGKNRHGKTDASRHPAVADLGDNTYFANTRHPRPEKRGDDEIRLEQCVSLSTNTGSNIALPRLHSPASRSLSQWSYTRPHRQGGGCARTRQREHTPNSLRRQQWRKLTHNSHLSWSLNLPHCLPRTPRQKEHTPNSMRRERWWELTHSSPPGLSQPSTLSSANSST